MLNLNRIISYVLLLLSIALALCSCGTRKRVMEKTSTKVNTLEQKDIVAIKVNDITTDVQIIRTNDRVVYKAVDQTKPFFVEGKKYENVIIEKEFSKEVDSSQIKDNTRETKTDKSIQKTEIVQKEKKVAVERDNSFGFWDWFWLLLALIAVFFLVFRWNNIYAWIINLFKKVIV
ncbi:hypothetical protein [uncultured Aquimarina sp.]|uniref:hypothetical protein n=1 Tax=uncultured Aquimarina sp. TaxID=575652 RepID=UPI002606BEFC|nr:hypothetical protein [uncultured Aquimarina sp.]